MTTLYLIRHSIPMKCRNNIINSDSLQVWNEKNPLSVLGEEKAKEYCKNRTIRDWYVYKEYEVE